MECLYCNDIVTTLFVNVSRHKCFVGQEKYMNQIIHLQKRKNVNI